MRKLTENVQAFENEMQNLKGWYKISKNLKSESCKDAVSKRVRLGKTGIPLSDELKSNFGYMEKNGQRTYILLHCRGNQKIDFIKVEKIIGGLFKRIDKQELNDLFGLEYGRINPLINLSNITFAQIFDKTTIRQYTPPYTMTTNAGDLNWGVEFKPKELIDRLPNTQIADIIEDSSKIDFKHYRIGVLTGNSPESGTMLWNSINEKIREKIGKNHFLGDISFPPVYAVSLPEMGISMELQVRLEDTRKTVLYGIESLCKSGANLITIACNTTQYFISEIKEICKEHNAEFISIPETTYNYLQKNNIKSFDFLALGCVADKQWSAFTKVFDDFEVHIPDNKALDKINKTAFKVKQTVVDSEGINSLRDLIQNSTETNTILLALTELSILFASQKKNRTKKIFLDTLSILADAIADIYVAEISKVYHLKMGD